jgi:PAS domain S-box-containing protein
VRVRFRKGFWAQLSPGQIAGFYFVVSTLWILISDQALGFWGLSAGRVTQISVLKGAMFVGVSTWLIYRLIGMARGRAEEELRNHRAYLDELFETAPVAICLLDMNTRILSVNQEFTRMFGYEKEEVIGRDTADLIVPDELRNEIEGQLHSIALGERLDKETIRVRKDGTRVCVSMVAAPAMVEGGLAAIHVVYRDLTERKRAEMQLQATAERLKAILENAPVGIVINDREGHTIEPNAAYQRICGYSAEELKGTKFTDYTYPDDVAKNLQLYEQLRSHELQSYEMEKRYIRKDGKTIWVRVVAAELNDGNNVGIVEDITAHKQAEQQLQATADRLQAILDNAPVGIVITDSEGHLIEYNAAHLRMCGYSAEELKGTKFTDYTHPDDIAKNLQLFELVTSGKRQSVEIEKRYLRKDGTTIWGRVISSRLNKEFNIGIIEDVTERKKAAEALRESERLLRAVIDLVPHFIFVKNRESRYLLANRACAEASGISSEQMVGRRTIDHLSDRDEAERFMKEDREVIDSGRPKFTAEETFHDITGRVRTHQTIKMPFVAPGTGEPALIGVAVDITEIKLAQRALAESEERLRTIVGLAPDGIFVASDQGRIIEVNEAACEQLGYTRDQLLQLRILDFIPSRFAQRASARLRGQVPSGTYESAHIRADGVEVPVELSVAKIVFRGQPAFIGIARDISDRKRAEQQREKLEQQLRQAQKMEAVGRLAGGIAHDFNNLLMVIQSYTEMLQDSLPARDTLRNNTQQIMKAADRAASLTRQMLAYSRKQILSPVVLDLNAVIGEAAKMLRRLIGEDIEFRVNAAEPLWAIEADPDQIVQVLMNLCLNARDAMPQGGTLTVTTGNATVKEGSVGGQPYVLPGDYVKMSVTDTGMGVSKEMQGQIFEPFFTTKEVGKGTGLGLATVYGIVKQSGGYVWVDSELGQGASFRIYLPRAKGATAPDMSAKAEARPRGTETILVAEDEEALREAICDYLRSVGYKVFAASSGQHALSVASQHEGRIDLLITDLVMPKMSGRELSQMLGSLRPDLKTIYMSGHSDDAVLRHGIQEMGTTFLQKPFSLGTLARKVRETLGRKETVQ